MSKVKCQIALLKSFSRHPEEVLPTKDLAQKIKCQIPQAATASLGMTVLKRIAAKQCQMSKVGMVIAIISIAMAAAPATQPAFRQAMGPRQWAFPRDHGRHDGFKTEWWYFTGNLRERGSGREFGYQLTFFRSAFVAHATTRPSGWGMSDLYFAHAAISDVQSQQFLFADRLSRGRDGLAMASADSLDVVLKDWSAKMGGDRIHLIGGDERFAMDLNVTLTPPVLEGPGGLNPKGLRPGQASYYYSMVRMPTAGKLTVDGKTFEIEGDTWMDHEFSSNALTENQAGWDWLAITLADGTDLMIYRLRDKSGRTDYLSGTRISRGGGVQYLSASDIELTPSQPWKSPASGANYPQHWLVKVRDLPTMIVQTRITNQELQTPNSTKVTYYEGTIGVTNEKGQAIGEGYLEMTGYAGELPR